jgi:hypothetical protein
LAVAEALAEPKVVMEPLGLVPRLLMDQWEELMVGVLEVPDRGMVVQVLQHLALMERFALYGLVILELSPQLM